MSATEKSTLEPRRNAYGSAIGALIEFLEPQAATIAGIIKAAHAAAAANVPDATLDTLETAIMLRKEVSAFKLKRCAAAHDAVGLPLQTDRITSALEEVRRALRGEDTLREEMVASMGVVDEVTTLCSEPTAAAAAAARVGEIVRILDGDSKGKIALIRDVAPLGNFELLVDGRISTAGGGVLARVEGLASGSDPTEAEELSGGSAHFGASCFAVDVEELLTEVDRTWSDYRSGKSTLLVATSETNACVRHASAWAGRLEAEHEGLNRVEHILACAYLRSAVEFARASLGGGEEAPLAFEVALGLVAELAFGNEAASRAPSTSTAAATAPPGSKPPPPPPPSLNVAVLCLARFEPEADPEGSAAMLQRAHAAIRRRAASASVAQCDVLLDVVIDCAARNFLCCASSANLAVMLSCEGGGGGAADNGSAALHGDPLAGGNGLLLTSGWLRAWVGKNAMRAPTSWAVHVPGSSGRRPWHEIDSPATCLGDLEDYVSSSLPALMYCCHFDARTTRDAKAMGTMPDVRADSLMPLWPLLHTAMTQRWVSTALTFAVHALVLSLLRVNGERRCARIAITTKASLLRLLQQLDRDSALYTDPACHLRVDLMQWWISNSVSCANSQWLPNRLEGAELALAKAQLDAAMFHNPCAAARPRHV